MLFLLVLAVAPISGEDVSTLREHLYTRFLDLHIKVIHSSNMLHFHISPACITEGKLSSSQCNYCHQQTRHLSSFASVFEIIKATLYSSVPEDIPTFLFQSDSNKTHDFVFAGEMWKL